MFSDLLPKCHVKGMLLDNIYPHFHGDQYSSIYNYMQGERLARAIVHHGKVRRVLRPENGPKLDLIVPISSQPDQWRKKNKLFDDRLGSETIFKVLYLYQGQYGS